MAIFIASSPTPFSPLQFHYFLRVQNIQKCVTAGVGERIHIKSLTTEELKSKLLKVLGNKRYVLSDFIGTSHSNVFCRF